MTQVPGIDTLLHRQADLVQEVLGRERRLQRELLTRAFAPLDSIFDVLEQSGAAMREEAEAIEHAARALEQAAALMKTQAELYERAVHVLREPSRLVESAVGLGPGGDPPE